MSERRSSVEFTEETLLANPFWNRTARLTALEGLKMFLMFPIVLIRVALALICGLFLVLICALATCGMDFEIDPATNDRKPMSGCRRALIYPVRLLSRCVLFCLGYVWIEERFRNGTCCSTAANVIVANHVCWVEPLYFLARELPCCVAKAELASSFLGRVLAKSLNLVLVDRYTTEGKKAALAQIANRARPECGFPPLLVFPEGTTSSPPTLITFKRGAFTAMQPVQPVVVRFPHCHFDPGWVPGVGTVWHAWRMLSQVYNRLQVDWLPVVEPTQAEISRGAHDEFGTRVQHSMAQAVEPPLVVTSHMFQDVQLLYKVDSMAYSLKTVNSVTSVSELHTLLSWQIEDVQWAVEKFKSFDSNKDGMLDAQEFCRGLKLSETDPSALLLFNTLDKDGLGFLDFKEAALAVAFLNPGLQQELATKLCFLLFSSDGSRISRADLEGMLDFARRVDPGASFEQEELLAGLEQHEEALDLAGFTELTSEVMGGLFKYMGQFRLAPAPEGAVQSTSEYSSVDVAAAAPVAAVAPGAGSNMS